MADFSIRPEFMVDLKGKAYCTWPGVLDAATRAGLKSLTTTLEQLTATDKGYFAVVKARAEFEDGRVFEDYGDAGPQNCSPQMASASIRLASTRAKGRCLRDAINCGQTMREELPDRDEEQPTARSPSNGAEKPVQREERPPLICCSQEGCGVVLSGDEIKAGIHYAEAFDAKPYCTEHGKPLVKAWKAAQGGEKPAPSVNE